jgi:hypothetical protein
MDYFVDGRDIVLDTTYVVPSFLPPSLLWLQLVKSPEPRCLGQSGNPIEGKCGLIDTLRRYNRGIV